MGMGSANADAASASSAALSALPLSKMKAGVVGAVGAVGELGGQTKGGGEAPATGRIDALLEYYRARVAQFEKEREELLLKLDACSVSFQEAHRTSWEMKKKEEEVKELQRRAAPGQLESLAGTEQALEQVRVHLGDMERRLARGGADAVEVPVEEEDE